MYTLIDVIFVHFKSCSDNSFQQSKLNLKTDRFRRGFRCCRLLHSMLCLEANQKKKKKNYFIFHKITERPVVGKHHEKFDHR